MLIAEKIISYLRSDYEILRTEISADLYFSIITTEGRIEGKLTSYQQLYLNRKTSLLLLFYLRQLSRKFRTAHRLLMALSTSISSQHCI